MTEQTLKQRINDAMKDAMRARDKARLGTIRLIQAEIKKVEVDQRTELDDDEIISLLDKMVKQRRESVKQYEAGDRQELADKEKAEIAVIQDFLPAAMSDEEIAAEVDKAVAETGASGMADMGKVMNTVRPRVMGRADMSTVSRLVKQKLG